MKNCAGIIAGLGNPGPRYAHTRHNFGFLAADRLLAALGDKRPCPPVPAGADCQAFDCPLTGQAAPHWLLLKPLTFMNLSGVAVARLCRRFGVEPQRLLVLHDEMDLPLGRMKLKLGGGDAGHNGISSIAQELGSRDFYRLRLGVGRPGGPGDPAHYVLSDFSPEETLLLDPVLQAAVAGIRTFARRGPAQAAQQINVFDARPEESRT
ncbi:MAG: aminoacyl-tRNA hydrolase [Thermodesulfobacteriota bacterium]